MSQFGCTPHIIPLPKLSLSAETIRKINGHFEQVNAAAADFAKVLSSSTIAKELERHREEIRWRNDPLELKARFLDPIPVFVAEQLRAIANQIDP